MAGRKLALFLVLSLLANAFSLPTDLYRYRRTIPDSSRTRREMSSSDRIKEVAKEVEASMASSTLSTTAVAIAKNKSSADDDDDDDDDDFGDDFDKPTSSSGGDGGSNIFSLLKLANAFFPSSSTSGGTTGINHKLIQAQMKKIIRESWARNQLRKMQELEKKASNKREDINDNVIDIDYTADLKPPPFQRQESEEDGSDSSESEEDNGEVESGEELENGNGNGNGETNSKQDSDDDENDSDYDEPPEGDGQGGGILGLLAGLSGDGDSDLGTLLATVGGIVANLSGDGIDLNAIIATALGLFVGLLSDGTQNPGEIIASYLLTSLDTITGGGAKNNGAFFGKFLSKLLKGSSAAGDPDDASEENGPVMADSAGFFASLLMGLLGEMSKGSSGGSWR